MVDREVQELEAAVDQIWEIATTRFGLDPFPVRFEIVPATVMYEVGSYALPGRYSHWTFGKAYHRMKMMYDFGLSKIYEVVINSNPSYAFLLETNSPTQNKMVIAHVLGHIDFFKNNVYFSKTIGGWLTKQLCMHDGWVSTSSNTAEKSSKSFLTQCCR